MTKKIPNSFATRAVHHGWSPADAQGAVTPPIHVSSTYAFEKAADAAATVAGERHGFLYTRAANPTSDLLERRLAALEGGQACVVFGSGMGALAATMWTLLSSGDEVVSHRTLYGCTYDLLTDGLTRFGITVRWLDLRDLDSLANALSTRTKAIVIECPVNPTLEVMDLARIGELAQRYGARLIVDGTFSTPYLLQPLRLGANLVVHSATKFLGGHSDLLAGAVIGSSNDIDRIRKQGLRYLTGAVLSPRDAHLVLRGMKSLKVRLDYQCDSAERIGAFLQSHPRIKRVFYPGRWANQPEARLSQQMRRGGAVLAFELMDGKDACWQFMDRLTLITRAVSLGGAESLIEHPASMTHPSQASRGDLGAASEDLLRLAVGLEDVEDLIEDLESALAAD